MSSITLQPLYTSQRIAPAYCLRYSWTGWPKRSAFQDLCSPEILDCLAPQWEQDGLRLIEYQWKPKNIQLTFSTTPEVSPVFLATRAKGRLQHELRKAECRQEFSRKVSVRSVGDNTADQVNNYIANQVNKEQFVDPQFERKLKAFTIVDPKLDLSLPNASASGRYWFNLHLVLEVEEEIEKLSLDQMAKVRDGCLRVAAKKGHGIARLSVMLNHLHIALRGNESESPEEIAVAYQNNLAYLLNQQKIWRDTYYVGTFGEYHMGGVRSS